MESHFAYMTTNDGDEMLSYLTEQMSAKRGLKYFGDAGEDCLRTGDVGGPVKIVVDCGECFHVTQVSSRWGSGSGLTPGFEHAA